MAPRFFARLIVSVGVLVLGAMAALRLPLDFVPSRSFPQLQVSLSLAEASDVDELTRRYLVPLESAIRSIGRVRGVGGEVFPRGARLQVVLQPGTDTERKAARLESELGALRRRLPADSELGAWPVGEGTGERAAVIWIRDSQAMAHDLPAFVDALESRPEIRSVTVAGEGSRELRITPQVRRLTASRVGQAIDRWLAVRRLGSVEVGTYRIPVLTGAKSHRSLDRLPVALGQGAVPLAAVAEMRWREEEPLWLAHVDGRPGGVLFVERESGASPLALERVVRRTLKAFALEDQARLLFDEATPLRRLLRRLLLGLLLASVVMGVLASTQGGWRTGLSHLLALPLALAAGLNVLWLTGHALDVTTLPVLWAALAASLPYLAWRQTGGAALPMAVTMSAAAALLPVAVALAGGRLAPFLAGPARVFPVAVLASIVALWILPAPRAPEARARREVAVGLRTVLRNPWTVLLTAGVMTYGLLLLCGRALEPVSGTLAPAEGDLVVELRFAEGTSLAGARTRVAAVETHLQGLEEIAEHWSAFRKEGGSVSVRVRPGERSPAQLRALAARLRYQLSSIPAGLRIATLADATGSQARALTFGDDLEERAEADWTFYRFILRSTEAKTLEDARDQAIDTLTQIQRPIAGYRITRPAIHSEWARPSVRVELLPRPGARPQAVRGATAVLRQRARLPFPRPFAAGRDVTLRVVSPWAPQGSEEVLRRNQLTGIQSFEGGPSGVIVPAEILQAREASASPAIKRQAGRFVLPITVEIPHILQGRYLRREIHRILGRLRLPPGCDLERPKLGRKLWQPEQVRMLAVACTLPALLLALAICRLNSALLGVVSLAPAVVGTAAATPWIMAATGRADELTLLGLAAALCGAVPMSLEVAAVVSQRGAGDPTPAGYRGVGPSYRWLVRHGGWIAIAVLGWLVLLALPGLGVDSARQAWVLPLRVAAIAGAVAGAAALVVLPPLVRGVGLIRDRDPEKARQASHPPTWRRAAGLVLETRSLTKIYGDGYCALQSVEFRLGPGIVGLLGPNGAGKTTLLRLLCGLLEPTRGQVLFGGLPVGAHNLAEYRRRVGFLPQESNAYEGLTGEQFLDYWALERGLLTRGERQREIARVLEVVGLEGDARRKVRQYSGGMRRRIGIARALLGSPPILIVDEPTTGLDVESRNRLRETLLAAAGDRIILFSTHIASDVAATATRILLLHQGRLRFDGPPSELLKRARGRVFEVLVGDDELAQVSHRYRVTTRLRTLDGVRIRAVARHGEEPPGEIVEPNLEEAYLAAISESMEDRDWSQRRGRSLLDLSG